MSKPLEPLVPDTMLDDEHDTSLQDMANSCTAYHNVQNTHVNAPVVLHVIQLSRCGRIKP
jgi:hypothetical protein